MLAPTHLVIVCLCMAMLSFAPARAEDPPGEEEYGTPSKTIKGELVEIQGQYYVVRDLSGREVRFHWTEDTEVAGMFKPGDYIEVKASPLEHAMYIQAVKPNSVPSGESAAATKKFQGELLAIEGPYYVIKDSQGKEVRLFISRDTELAGAFQPGDMVEAVTSPVEHALSIHEVE